MIPKAVHFTVYGKASARVTLPDTLLIYPLGLLATYKGNKTKDKQNTTKKW